MARLGPQVEAALRKALVSPPSAEVRRRLEYLLAELEKAESSPELRRALRAVEILEHIGTPEAGQLLEALARGGPDAPLTQEARAARQRLARR